jgi:hypothetical protein
VKLEIGERFFWARPFTPRRRARSFVGVKLQQALSGLAALNKIVQEFGAFLHPAAR